MFENFLMLGGQLRNSSAYDADAVQKGFEAIAAFGGNTAELPVYWEQVEPQEGRFHFDHVGRIIEAARARGLKLILLWFGTWKNATDSYVPEWIKTDPERFPVVQTPSGAPLLIPESAANVSGAMMLTRAIADFGAVGVAAFGIEGILDSRGEVLPQALPWVLQMRVFKAMTPLLLKYRGAGRVHAVVQEEWSGSEHLIFADGWQGAVNFGFLNTDHAHNRDKLVDRGWDQLRGMGLIVQGEEDTFYLGGMGYYLRLYRPSWQDGASELAMNSAFALRQSPYLSVEEGCFEPDGTWRTLRRRNGDETDGGLWVHPDTLVRVRLYRR